MATLFFSYSHRDEVWRNELEIHLQALQRQGLIDTWHDRRIVAGDDVHDTISNQLESASIILLLVSPYFIASDYCYNVEMKRALERHSTGEARVIPVILEPCVWTDLPFGSLRATPTDGTPVSKHANPHDAFVDIVTSIRKALPESKENCDEAAKARPTAAAQSEGSAPDNRSSNLRIRREFTDEDRYKFLQESFEYMANFFEASLAELEARNTNITCQFVRVDARRFTAVVFQRGHELASGTVWLSHDVGIGHGINYVEGLQSGSNSYNESLSPTDDGYAQFLRSFGFISTSEENLTRHGAAELYWRRLIGRLQ